VSDPDPALEATRRGQFANLPRRVHLTFRHHGPRVLLRRALTFPLRFTPWARRLGIGRVTSERRAQARAWFASNARPVTVVIPSFGAAEEVARAVRSVQRTTPGALVKIIVTDDAGPTVELARLRSITGVELIEGERNLGFAGNVNRGLARAETDVVLMNADVHAGPGWLEALQWAAYEDAPGAGVVGARLLYPNGQIQHAGVIRNPRAPEWFDHRFRFSPGDHGPADVPGPVLAVTGACMYIKRELLGRIGELDPGYAMAFEDVDFCLRAWQAGYGVQYEPGAILTHAESTTRPREPGDRELASRKLFWERWGDFLSRREVTTDAGGRVRIVYVTHGTEVGGGHRLIFEDLNRLSARGHDVSLFTLGPEPEWFDLHVPVRTFAGYEELVAELAPLNAIKVATWWMTAEPVWRASVLCGIPVYYVQDLETSYYPDGEYRRHEVLASYRDEFRYLTISGWIRERLAELGHDAALLTPGLDHGTFRPLQQTERREEMVLAIGRANRLKRLDLTIGAWRSLKPPRPDLCMFGVEPEVVPDGARFVEGPSDGEVNELLNECTLFVQTSSHEGFALPPLEAMAAGAAVVCTDAHGNRDYCEDGVNCLMPEAKVPAIAAAIRRVIDEPGLRARLAAAGIETARGYDFVTRIDTLELWLRALTDSPPPAAPRA
jgi:GT2 family glycosyltransferase/glycosyltransferase involved in cell wall biosynthesis